MANKTYTSDYLAGAEEAFKIIGIYNGVMTPEQLAHERAEFAKREVLDIPQNQIDLSISRQATAQLREHRKEQEAVLANEPLLIAHHERMSKLYNLNK